MPMVERCQNLSETHRPVGGGAKYGADGLRHGIMSIAPKGQDIRFSEERIEQGRNFVTSYGMYTVSGRCQISQRFN